MCKPNFSNMLRKICRGQAAASRSSPRDATDFYSDTMPTLPEQDSPKRS
jgi:hypothetical protein